jgi:hypothetical protein
MSKVKKLSPSDFEFLPIDVNLARCQRYFEKGVTGASGGLSDGVGYLGSYVGYNVRKRTSATLTQSNQTYTQIYDNEIELGLVGVGLVSNDEQGFSHSAINGGTAARYRFTYTADSEL